MPSGRFLLCWGNRHRDLRHVGRGAVADDVVNEGYPADWCRPGAIRDSCRVGDLTMVVAPIVAVFIYMNININVYTQQ